MADGTIWKYVLSPGMPVRMPRGATVLHAAGQGDDLCVWALVDPQAPTEERRFDVYGTGHPCPAPEALGRYVGTAHLNDGALVFHVFEYRSIAADAERPANLGHNGSTGAGA